MPQPPDAFRDLHQEFTRRNRHESRARHAGRTSRRQRPRIGQGEPLPQTSQPDSDITPRPGRPYGVEAAREREDRTLRGLSALLDARPELLGVHAPADWVYDAVRWSA